MKVYNRFITLILVVITISSCSIERRLAHNYIKQNKPGSVLLLTPDFIYKNSFKLPEVDNPNQLTRIEKDSLAYFNSDVIQYASDSAFMDNFATSLMSGLKYFGYSVYFNESADKFLEKNDTDKTSFIANYVQVQLEEYLDSISDETSYDYSSSNTFEIFVTAININNWLELTRLNHIKTTPDLLFNSQTITDDFQGSFQYFPLTNEFDYYYQIDSLNVDKLYNAASELGLRHAQWICDYLMNEYVKKNLPPGQLPDKMYSYDYRNKILKRLRWQPFTPIRE